MSTTGFLVQSTKPNGPTFEIVRYDQETKEAVLRGSMGVEFKSNIAKDQLLKYGYKVVRASAQSQEDSHAG